MKKVFAIGLFALLLVPSLAMAAEFRSSEDGDVEVKTGEVTKNLYAAGGKGIITNSLIGGDLMAAGSIINVKEGTENNLFAAGKTIDVRGAIGRNVRVAGTDINIYGTVGEDVLAFGQNIRIDNDALIKGDLITAGTDVVINGKISGNVKCSGTTIVINGQVLGNVDIDGLSTLTVGSDAKIDGKLTYSSSKEGSISDQALIKNGVIYSKSLDGSSMANTTNIPGTSPLLGILIGLVTVIILVLLLPKWSNEASKSVASNFVHRLLWGFVALVIIPIASLLLMFTLLGIKLGFLLLFGYFLLLFVASMFSPIATGSIIFKAFQRDKTASLRVDWVTASIGVVALSVFALLPSIGWIIIFVFFLAALGQVSIGIWEAIAKQRS